MNNKENKYSLAAWMVLWTVTVVFGLKAFHVFWFLFVEPYDRFYPSEVGSITIDSEKKFDGKNILVDWARVYYPSGYKLGEFSSERSQVIESDAAYFHFISLKDSVEIVTNSPFEVNKDYWIRIYKITPYDLFGEWHPYELFNKHVLLKVKSLDVGVPMHACQEKASIIVFNRMEGIVCGPSRERNELQLDLYYQQDGYELSYVVLVRAKENSQVNLLDELRKFYIEINENKVNEYIAVLNQELNRDYSWECRRPWEKKCNE